MNIFVHTQRVIDSSGKYGMDNTDHMESFSIHRS